MAKPEKFQIRFLVSKIDNSTIKLIIGNKRVNGQSKAKLLGITIDNKFLFNKQIDKLPKITSNHLRALTRIRKYLSTEKIKHVSEAYVISILKYSPMVCMFFSKTTKNVIYNIHKCTLPVSHQVEDAGLEDLL